jgi:FixJ family two-component response regulator
MDTGEVLLVDDDVALRQALSETIALRMSTVEVEAVGSAQEALARLQEHTYGAIVSDIKMPGMDGLALLAQVQERHTATPLLLITGHSDHQLAIRALRGGAYDYILKPIDRDDFIAALHRALQTHRLQQQVEEQQRALERYALSLEQLVKQRTHELAATNRARETLLHMFTHELRSPLTNLKDIAREVDHHLQKAEETAGFPLNLAELKHPIRRMEWLVCDVEDSSLIQTQRLVLQRTRCDLVKLCQEVLVEDGAQESGVLESAEATLLVELDCERMRRVLFHLLASVRASTEAEGRIAIRIQKVETEAFISLSLRRTSVGEQACFSSVEHDAPVQASAGAMDAFTEGNWGFDIARALTEQHGGRIEVSRSPESGMSILVALPLTRPAGRVFR